MDATYTYKIMTRKKIDLSDTNVSIECPYCGMWEATGIDDSRKNFREIPVIEWIEEEVSINKCGDCCKKFEVEWDYNNDTI